MNIVELIAAYFYLQPSLIITFVPVQIISLFALLCAYRKSSMVKAFFHAFFATVFAIGVILLIGSLVIPFTHLSLFISLKISFEQSFILMLISSFVYWLLGYFYLRYLLKMPDIAKLSGLSSAIAGLAVLALYYLLWQ